MDKEQIRDYCLSFPGATEQVQWGSDLLFKIGGKMFACVNLEPAELRTLNLKCDPEMFAELTEREGIVPNKYLSRYHWISIRSIESLRKKELLGLIRASYDMVLAKLPRKFQAEIAAIA
ncbi:MAG: hypothetical protein JWQ98_1074 [Chlorobi bacterium]|nr:hypothetical protein [Chlorobiota bacterium]